METCNLEGFEGVERTEAAVRDNLEALGWTGDDPVSCLDHAIWHDIAGESLDYAVRCFLHRNDIWSDED